MKRSAAVVGPTPPFIAWSIRHPCALKADIDPHNPQSIERSLRALRDAGESIATGRQIEGLAFQAILDVDGPVRVASIAEVSAPFGGWSAVIDCCNGCVANLNSTGQVANCFGWLSQEEKGIEWLNRPSSEPVATRGQILNAAEIERQVCGIGFHVTDPLWYGLWIKSEVSANQFASLLSLFEQHTVANQKPCAVSQFVDALRVCASHEMILDIRSFPSGFSNGITWTLGPHCPDCKAAMPPLAKGCKVCLRSGSPHPPIKRKVRGHRPFVDLDQRYEQTEALRLRALIEEKVKSFE